MEQKQILLKQEVLSIDNDRIDYSTKNGNKSEILTKVMMRFTWIDCETGETDINLFGANGQNGFEMGLGSALTYAERYFILKYFHISTDEDDIDNPERKKTAITIEKPKLKLTKAGLDYLTTKGTKEEIQKALDERIITEVQKTALETTLTTKK